jgi:hypothetical protein
VIEEPDEAVTDGDEADSEATVKLPEKPVQLTLPLDEAKKKMGEG